MCELGQFLGKSDTFGDCMLSFAISFICGTFFGYILFNPAACSTGVNKSDFTAKFGENAIIFM